MLNAPIVLSRLRLCSATSEKTSYNSYGNKAKLLIAANRTTYPLKNIVTQFARLFLIDKTG
jgi:hypothetical protein